MSTSIVFAASAAGPCAGLSRSGFIDALSASGVSPVQETLEEIRDALARG